VDPLVLVLHRLDELRPEPLIVKRGIDAVDDCPQSRRAGEFCRQQDTERGIHVDQNPPVGTLQPTQIPRSAD